MHVSECDEKSVAKQGSRRTKLDEDAVRKRMQPLVKKDQHPDKEKWEKFEDTKLFPLKPGWERTRGIDSKTVGLGYVCGFCVGVVVHSAEYEDTVLL